MSEEIDLKNCPFCGSKPVYGDYLYSHYSPYIHCSNINCCMLDEDIYFYKKEGAIKAWNTRADDDFKIGDYNFEKGHATGKIFIRKSCGEEREFSIEDFEDLVDKFYRNNFL